MNTAAHKTARKTARIVATAAASLVLSLGLVGGSTPPAYAGGTGAISDPSGVDYDAGCMASINLTAPPANSIGSPSGTGCAGVSVYDGSTETTDLRSASLESTGLAGLGLKATFVVDGPVPAAGGTNLTDGDGPGLGFNGYSYRLLFQNLDKQTTLDNAAGGCTTTSGGRKTDRHGSHLNGYHFFLDYSVAWDGLRWVHSASVGEYWPTLDGGFYYTDLGRSTSPGSWTTIDPAMTGRWSASASGTSTGPTTLTVEVSGIVHKTDTGCMGGVLKTAYATAGDRIANVKGLTTADVFVTSSVAGSVGGFNFYSDVTEGHSTPGMLNSNISGISYTGGAIGLTDVIGVGGLCTGACVDDGSTTGHTFLTEWWPTSYGFIA